MFGVGEMLKREGKTYKKGSNTRVVQAWSQTKRGVARLLHDMA